MEKNPMIIFIDCGKEVRIVRELKFWIKFSLYSILFAMSLILLLMSLSVLFYKICS